MTRADGAEGHPPLSGVVAPAKTASSPKPVRMRRSPGGRSTRLNVRLTEEEARQIRRRANESGRSAQRFLLECALSGSAAASADRRRAQKDAERAQLVLAGLSNNVNQLAKWANTNETFPDPFPDCLDAIRRAAEDVAEAVGRYQSIFETAP